MHEDAGELETQKRVYMLISKEPGLHISKIAQVLEVSEPLVLYHIHYLEKRELISVEKEGGFSRCYPKGIIGVEDKKKFSILRQYLPAQIVLFLLKNPSAKHKEIHEHFDIAKSTLSYHLQKLLRREIISVHESAGEQRYLVVDEQGIILFLMKYKPLGIAVGMKETWDEFTIYKK
jgi:predicted transcriptional regulator